MICIYQKRMTFPSFTRVHRFNTLPQGKELQRPQQDQATWCTRWIEDLGLAPVDNHHWITDRVIVIRIIFLGSCVSIISNHSHCHENSPRTLFYNHKWIREIVIVIIVLWNYFSLNINLGKRVHKHRKIAPDLEWNWESLNNNEFNDSIVMVMIMTMQTMTMMDAMTMMMTTLWFMRNKSALLLLLDLYIFSRK